MSSLRYSGGFDHAPQPSLAFECCRAFASIPCRKPRPSDPALLAAASAASHARHAQMELAFDRLGRRLPKPELVQRGRLAMGPFGGAWAGRVIQGPALSGAPWMSGIEQ